MLSVHNQTRIHMGTSVLMKRYNVDITKNRLKTYQHIPLSKCSSRWESGQEWQSWDRMRKRRSFFPASSATVSGRLRRSCSRTGAWIRATPLTPSLPVPRASPHPAKPMGIELAPQSENNSYQTLSLVLCLLSFGASPSWPTQVIPASPEIPHGYRTSRRPTVSRHLTNVMCFGRVGLQFIRTHWDYPPFRHRTKKILSRIEISKQIWKREDVQYGYRYLTR